MKAILLGIILIVLLLIGSSCNRGDVKITPVIENQIAPHAGYNIGPDMYVEPGDLCPITGAVIWIKGLDPNDILGE